MYWFTAESLMEQGTASGAVHNAKTLRDEFGRYPVWLNQRKVKQLKIKSKKIKKVASKVRKRSKR